MSETDDNATTQPILERIWFELASISRHLDEQDKKIDNVRGQTNLAGNIASEAMVIARETREIVRSIDQSLTGIYELAKSGFDIATAIRSAQDTERPPPDNNDPIIEVDDLTYRKFSIVGTGN